MSKVNWCEVIVISLFGGIGAVVLLVTGSIAETIEFESFWLVCKYFFAGAAAGFIGVYGIARSDTTNHFIHCLGFAMVCGLSWELVFETAGNMVFQTRELSAQSQITHLADNNKSILNQLAEFSTKVSAPSQEEVKAKTEELVNNVITLISDSEKITDPVSRNTVFYAVSGAFDAMQYIQSINPKVASDARKRLDLAVSTSSDPSVNPNITVSKSLFNR